MAIALPSPCKFKILKEFSWIFLIGWLIEINKNCVTVTVCVLKLSSYTGLSLLVRFYHHRPVTINMNCLDRLMVAHPISFFASRYEKMHCHDQVKMVWLEFRRCIWNDNINKHKMMKEKMDVSITFIHTFCDKVKLYKV